jgi:hypothetical protein
MCRSLACWVLSVIATPLFSAEPIVIASGDGPTAPKQPQVAVFTDGTVHLVYGSGDSVFHCRSTDGGSSFEKPKEAFRVSHLSLGMRRGPRVAVTKDALVVTVIGGRQGNGRDGDVQAWRSIDGGTTWKGPVNVNDSADSAREGLHGMAAGADGSLWCVWLDLRDKRSEVFAAKSTDGGATWQTNVRVYRSPDGNVCECCHPSIAVAEGAVHVMFRNSLAGNRDMYVTTSKDDGATFSEAKKLGNGAWKLNACPMDGGMLAAGQKGSLVTAWRRDGEVYTVATSNGKEKSLGRGEQPWAATSKNGVVIVWTVGREGDLFIQMAGTNQPQKLSEGARDPMVASATNREGPVIACWESKRDGQSIVSAARIDVSKLKSR